MKQLHKKRAISPNNVTSETKRILQSYGFEVGKGNKGRVIVNKKEYTLTTTSYKLLGPDARQYDTSTEGLVTLWLADGNYYIFDRFELGYKAATRELGEKEFVQVDAKENLFNTVHLLSSAKVQIKSVYRDSVEQGIDEAYIQQKEILSYLR